MEKVGKILGACLPRPALRSESPVGFRTPASMHVTRQPNVVHRAPVEETGEAIEEPQNPEPEQGVHQLPPRRRRRLGVQTDLTQVKAILSKVLAYRGLDKRVERYEFILHWSEIVGERLAEVSKPQYIRNKALIVQVLHPAWAQELTMIKPVLLESLARYLKPGDVVRDMVFRVGSFNESWS